MFFVCIFNEYELFWSLPWALGLQCRGAPATGRAVVFLCLMYMLLSIHSRCRLMFLGCYWNSCLKCCFVKDRRKRTNLCFPLYLCCWDINRLGDWAEAYLPLSVLFHAMTIVLLLIFRADRIQYKYVCCRVIHQSLTDGFCSLQSTESNL